jgi:hypothetical protein
MVSTQFLAPFKSSIYQRLKYCEPLFLKRAARKTLAHMSCQRDFSPFAKDRKTAMPGWFESRETNIHSLFTEIASRNRQCAALLTLALGTNYNVIF